MSCLKLERRGNHPSLITAMMMVNDNGCFVNVCKTSFFLFLFHFMAGQFCLKDLRWLFDNGGEWKEAGSWVSDDIFLCLSCQVDPKYPLVLLTHGSADLKKK